MSKAEGNVEGSSVGSSTDESSGVSEGEGSCGGSSMESSEVKPRRRNKGEGMKEYMGRRKREAIYRMKGAMWARLLGVQRVCSVDGRNGFHPWFLL